MSYKDTKAILNTSHKWVNLSLDILLMEANKEATDYNRLCAAYEMEYTELLSVLNNPEFRKQHEKVRQWLESAGDESPTVIQSAIMATNLKETLFMECMQTDVPFKDKLSFLQELQKDLPRAQDKQETPTGPVINISLNSNIRGMSEFVGRNGTIASVGVGSTYTEDGEVIDD